MSGQGPADQSGVLGAVARSAPLPIAVVDSALRIIEANPAFRHLVRRTPGALVGQPVAGMLPGVAAAALDAALRPATERREPVLGARLGETRRPSDRAWSVSAFPVIGDESLAVLVEDVTDRLLLERQASTAAARASLLLDAGFSIGTTLDVEATVREVVKVLVPAFADQVVVDLLPGDLVPRQAGSPGRPSPAARSVADSARASIVDITDVTALDEVSRSPAHREALAAERVHSFCCVPLMRLDHTIGMLSAYATGERAGFGEHDLALLREVATRVSIAIEHAESFDAAHRTAVELQRQLLPAEVSSSPMAHVATRYVPGRAATAVGGDWYDVIPGVAGRTAFTVGDVMGRGVHAAAMMGQIRTAMRTLASADPPPGELLVRLGEVVRELNLAPFATCLYGVYDPGSRRLTLASAGHLPPVLRDPSGRAAPVPLPAGPPLGVAGDLQHSAVDECEIEVADGSVLALYTDGLVEQRDVPLENRLRLLSRSLASAGDSLEVSCDTVLADLVPSRSPDDDLALLLARLRSLPPEWVVRAAIPADPTCARQARQLAAELSTAWRFTAELDEVRVMVSELVTNAVRYGRDSRQLTLTRLPDRLCAEVSDEHESHPWLRPTTPFSERGRGLSVVAALADRWGSRPMRDGKAVWFEKRTLEPATVPGLEASIQEVP